MLLLYRIAFVVFIALPGAAQTARPEQVRQRIHQEVRRMLQAEKPRVLFSEIHSSPDFSADEKAYAARLYEVFFAIPASLKTVWESEGRPPSRFELAADFGIEIEALDLLLQTMTADRRMPRLIELDPDSREIASIDEDAVAKFVEARGSGVRLTGWQGSAFPDFHLTTFQGRPFGLGELEGKAFLAWLWVTRCPVCRRLAPIVVELDNRFSGEGFAVVGFNADRVLGLSPDDQERRSYADEQGMRFTNLLLDSQGWRSLGNLNIFPSFFLVDAEGKVQRLFINAQEPETLHEAVRHVLGSGSHAKSQRR